MMNVLASSIMDFSPEMPLIEKILFSLAVSAIGIIIVFVVLILIMMVIYLFKAVFGVKKKATSDEPKRASVSKEASAFKDAAKPVPAAASQSKAKPASSGNQEETVAAIAAATAMAQEELIAVLSAAVAAREGCDAGSSRYRIRSFRRIL